MLNKNSDFYSIYLTLKRAKTPMAMHEAINKYKDVLGLSEHHKLSKTIITIIEPLYKRFNQDAESSNVRFESLKVAVKMTDHTAIDWKKNMREELYIEWTQEAKRKVKREDALAMLHKGFSPELIGEITKLPLEGIEKLQAQKV